VADAASGKAPVLLTQPARDEVAELGVPQPSANIFSRIIRDPTAPDRPMRERRCTEMLCAVLMNCPDLRAAVLRWMARAAGQPHEMIDELDWRFDTERPTLRGRDT